MVSEKKKGSKVSLDPLTFEEALSGLLQVEPPEKQKKGPPKKREDAEQREVKAEDETE